MATVKLNSSIITSISGPAGSVRAAFRRRPFIDLGPYPKQPPVKDITIRASRVPILRQAKRRIPDMTRTYWYRGKRCSCMAYTIADYLWISHNVDHDLWNKAVKRPNLSGYGLWISEAVACAKNGYYYPDVPSVSGGYQTGLSIPGVNFQPPADCLSACPQDLHISAHVVSNTVYPYDQTFTVRPYVIEWEWPEHPTISIRWQWFCDLFDPTYHLDYTGPDLYPTIVTYRKKEHLRYRYYHIRYCEPGIYLTYESGGRESIQPWILQSIDQRDDGYHRAQGMWK